MDSTKDFLNILNIIATKQTDVITNGALKIFDLQERFLCMITSRF